MTTFDGKPSSKVLTLQIAVMLKKTYYPIENQKKTTKKLQRIKNQKNGI